MDAMKEAFKRHISKHQVKGKPVADDAEDPTHQLGKDDQGEMDDNAEDMKKSDHAPSLHGGDPDEGGGMLSGNPPNPGMQMHGHQPGHEDLLALIHKALMGAGDHMGRGAMSLNEHAKDSMMKRMKK